MWFYTTYDIVEHRMQNGIIPEKYKNEKDLSAIINFIFQGVNDTGNTEISEIGMNIINAIER